MPGVTEAQCLADTDHDTNLFGHKDCYFEFNWRAAFSECYDGELIGMRQACDKCVIAGPEVPSCLTYASMTPAECDAESTCEAGYLRTTFDNSLAEDRMDEVDGCLGCEVGKIANVVDAWASKLGQPERPVDQAWLTWAASVDRQTECEAFDSDSDGTPDGLYGVTKCTVLGPAVGSGPWIQTNGLVIPGFDPTEIDGIAVVAPALSCGQGAGAGVLTLKVFNPATTEDEVYKIPGFTISFPDHWGGVTPDCTDSTDPWCGGDVVFIHELIHALGVGFHAYGPGFYNDVSPHAIATTT